MTIKNGIIFKEQEIIIPEVVKADIQRKLHQCNQGIEQTRVCRRENVCVCWPNISKDINHLVKSCDICQEFANANPKEPPKLPDIPISPCKTPATDLFDVKMEPFLLICNYFSK